MLRAKLPLICLILALAVSLFPDACIGRGQNKHCSSSFCGNLNINYPFRLKTQRHNCGFDVYELECDKNNHTIFPMKHGNFYVQNISYSDQTVQTIQLVDVNLDKENCSLPHSSYPFYTPSGKELQIYNITTGYSRMYLVNCRMKMMNNSSVKYINASRCSTSTNQYSSSPTPPNYFYFLDPTTAPSDFDQSCIVEAQVPIMLDNISGLSTFDIYKKLMMGVQLYWSSYPDDYSFFTFLHWNSIGNV
ncbi:hypothetical protein REPUB_Repub11eG0028800 [Reevesia pubescens]